MIDFDDVHRMIFSPTGAGKSYFAGWLAEQFYDQGKRWIILDTQTKNHIGLILLENVKLLKIMPNTEYNFYNLLNYDHILCIPTKRMPTEELIQQYEQILNVLFSAEKPITIFLEEAHRYNPSSHKPSKIVELIAREGRGLRINAIFITQRIQDFPKLLWEQCKRTYLFKCTHPTILNYIKQLIPEFEEINLHLRQYDVLEYNHTTQSYKIIRKEKVKRRTKHYG